MRQALMCVLTVLMITGGWATRSIAQEPGTSPSTKAAVVVNLNTATAEQLAALPGVGARTAERIIEYRQKNGPFKKPEDLMNVKGIGEKSFLRLKNLISAAPPKSDRSQPSAS